MDELAGGVTGEGLFSAGTLAGIFDPGLTATAMLGDTSVQGGASVTLNPGPPAALSLPPVEIAAGEALQLVANVVDQHGNALANIEVVWTLQEANVGEITPRG